MLTRLFQRIAAKKIEKRFHKHFVNANGSDLRRNAISVVMMELEDPIFLRTKTQLSDQEQPIFLMAFQSFVLWVLRVQLQQKAQPAELEEITGGVKERFATFENFNSSIFEKIWQNTEKLMPLALQGGRYSKMVYPVAHVIEAANQAGYPLPIMKLNQDFGMHILTVMQRIAFTFNPDKIPKT
jgi:hypothetical protein